MEQRLEREEGATLVVGLAVLGRGGCVMLFMAMLLMMMMMTGQLGQALNPGQSCPKLGRIAPAVGSKKTIII